MGREREADVAEDDTQPTPSETFVGREAGEDEGYAGETGAERRGASQHQDDRGASQHQDDRKEADR
jgi:hypothetical protein